ncbi:hypothetical protein IYX23_07500 [Methylocystis sp. L43]|uniref:hypothetical protein n=1 Tax=unclassified Methylocystis TaxID=2625913 RepID=UPI0018C2FF49|nr:MULTISPECIES: hypothetical protein [unclassified Methylocystis]MBG0797512.1 hypothetical protein [Methylocystis sp. L43]MBG0805117.1 hypothetical protein [Methylocystis sp. H15]
MRFSEATRTSRRRLLISRAKALIEAIERWERAPESERGDWEYYDHWVAALQKVIDERGLLTTT